MTDREMNDLMIFAYSTASVRARREQAKAIRHGARWVAKWLRERLRAHRRADGTAQLAACAGCEG